MEYTGTLEDGTVFDSSEEHGKPLVYIPGVGMMIPGFDATVMGMEIGEEKEITLQPEEAYGEYDERGVQNVPRSQFPKDFDPKIGIVLHLGTPNGDHFNAKVTHRRQEGRHARPEPRARGQGAQLQVEGRRFRRARRALDQVLR